MIISFSKTVEEFTIGYKRVTRRDWSDKHLEAWQRAWDKEKFTHAAWDKSPRNGGKYIGAIELAERPYKERLEDMPITDLFEEGGRWETIDAFCKELGKKPTDEVIVVRFLPRFDVEAIRATMPEDKEKMSRATWLAYMMDYNAEVFMENSLSGRTMRQNKKFKVAVVDDKYLLPESFSPLIVTAKDKAEYKKREGETISGFASIVFQRVGCRATGFIVKGWGEVYEGDLLSFSSISDDKRNAHKGIVKYYQHHGQWSVFSYEFPHAPICPLAYILTYTNNQHLDIKFEFTRSIYDERL